MADNILHNVLYRDGFLHEEADLLLRQELSDPRRYFSVLDAIAGGATRNSQIASRTVGAWWGKVRVAAKRSDDREVDAVALDGDGKVLTMGSCEWTSAKMDFGEETLLSQVEPYIPGADDVQRHYFFSRSGFTDQLHKLAESDPDRYRLVTAEDLYR